jgi:hypothetical protein
MVRKYFWSEQIEAAETLRTQMSNDGIMSLDSVDACSNSWLAGDMGKYEAAYWSCPFFSERLLIELNHYGG